MPRRSCRQALPGQLYAIEWPEWHVDCAAQGCNESTTIAGLGEAMDLKEAEKMATTANRYLKGWTKIKGLWHCPKHATGDV